MIALVAWLASSPAPADALLDIFDDVDQSGSALFGDAENTQMHRPVHGTVVPSATLRITLEGIRNDLGRIHVLAFDDSHAFSRGTAEQADGYTAGRATTGRMEIAVDVYGDGPWAIFAFHDENDDQQLDRRGPRPQEGYVYSGAVEPGFPPTFDRAARVEDTVTLHMWYLSTRMRR